MFVKSPNFQRDAKMLIKTLLIIIALFGVLLIPQSNAAPSKSSNPKSKNIQKKIGAIQDRYDDKIADIFEIPVPETSEVIRKCTNVVCIHFSLCVNDLVLSDGTDLFEPRFLKRSDLDPETNGIVCDDFEIPCCADQAITETEREQGDELPKNPEIIGDYDLDYGSNESVPKCGAIIGNNLGETKHPWIVSLYLRSSTDQLQYIGGGSLIQSSVILTAAHVIMGIQPDMLIIRADGDHSNTKRHERCVTNIIIHEELFVRTLINDIALIVTDRPFKLTDYVNIICLPPQSIQTSGGIMCTASGWKNGYETVVLEKFALPIVDRNQCENRLRQTRLGQYFILHPSLMCAGGLGFETCKGDRGSPLICEIPHLTDRFYQTGIMAGGLRCDENTPGIYVNIAHFADWIQQQLGFIGHNLDAGDVMPHKYFN